jgi:tetratricopeptide (TPR) repeat protein
MMVTKLTRTVVVGLSLLLAGPALAQNKKVDDAVAKALGQIEKGEADKALLAADKLAKEGGTEALLGASRIQAMAGKLEEAAASATQAAAAAAQATPEVRARLHAHIAGLEMVRGTGKEALVNARQAVEEQSTPETLAVLALAQANVKDAQALTTAEAAVKAAPTSAIAQDALGAALAAEGKLTEAEAALTKAIEIDPKLYRAHIHRAQVLLAAGRAADAEAAAKKATEIAPQHGLGFSLLAEAMLAKDPKNPNPAINEAQQAAFLSPHSAQVQYTVGRIFDAMGNSAQAAAAYRKVIEIDPGHSPARVAIIQSQIRSGNIDAGLPAPRNLAADNPNHRDAQFVLGQLLFRKDDYEGASNALEEATRRLPTNGEAFALLAAAYQRNGEKEQAVEAYKRAAELLPNNLDVRTNYGFALGITKQTAAAEAELKKVLASPGYKDAAAHIMLGWVYLYAEPKKPAEASVEFKKGLELDPKSAQAALGLGRAQLLQKSYADGIAALEKAAQLEPKLACEATYTTAWAYNQMAVDTKSKDVTKAKQALEQAQKCLPQADPRPAKLAAAIAKTEKGEMIAEAPPAPDIDDKPKGPDLPTVHRELTSTNPESRRAACRKMVAFGADAVPYLLPMISGDNDLGVRAAVAKALGAIGAPAAKACPLLATEISASSERMVLPTDSGGKKLTAEQEGQRFVREKDLQAACREARTKLGCK